MVLIGTRERIKRQYGNSELEGNESSGIRGHSRVVENKGPRGPSRIPTKFIFILQYAR